MNKQDTAQLREQMYTYPIYKHLIQFSNIVDKQGKLLHSQVHTRQDTGHNYMQPQHQPAYMQNSGANAGLTGTVQEAYERLGKDDKDNSAEQDGLKKEEDKD